MSAELKTKESFTDWERRALQAWEVGDPPAGLTSRALWRAQRISRQRRFNIWAVAASVIFVLGVMGYFSLRTVHPESGHLQANERQSLSLGDRAVAVVEAGASLKWSMDAKGKVELRQFSGNVFYRVNRSDRPFVVSTVSGTIRVMGTCFRVVVVNETEKEALPSSPNQEQERIHLHGKGTTPASAKSAAATITWVELLEGKISVATPQAELIVAQGHVVRLKASEPPLLLTGETAPIRRDDNPDEDRFYTMSSELNEMARKYQRLLQEKKQLETEQQALQTELAQMKQMIGEKRNSPANLSKEELLSLAKNCELRWDMPPVQLEPPDVSKEAAGELGLNETEKAAIKKVFKDHNQKLLDEIRRLYLQATGDKDGVKYLSPHAMISEITEKSPEGELKMVFQRLSQERAGLKSPPVDLNSISPTEKLYRLLTTAGDHVEKAIGMEIGPDLARQYREAKGGFGNQSSSSYGCP